MKKATFYLFCLITLYTCNTDTIDDDKKEIISIMNNQEQAWSNYDIEGFMKGYWKSDSLKFYGSNGITHGWEKTLANYKKRYPTKSESGKLTFTIDAITPIEDESYYVMGQYHLKRDIGNANGVFMIIFKKINGEFKIIADLSC